MVSDDIPTQKEVSQDSRFEEWARIGQTKYHALYQLVSEKLPDAWLSIEFLLSTLRILNIKNCTLPYAGILLGRPSSLKTVGIEMLRSWKHAFYTDSFSAKSFVSHSSSASREELSKIDLLPRIKNKMFMTPELAPMFSAKDDDLTPIFGIITRILDGHGYESDSGVHGHRGYHEQTMFVWAGAAVDIPRKVHRIMGNLGPRLYFLRLPANEKTEQEYLDRMRDGDKFQSIIDEIKESLFDYLNHFETCPVALVESGLPKIEWNQEMDDDEARRIIVRLAMLLARLRGTVPTWRTEDTQGSDYAFAMPIIEEPTRAATQLYNLARGHALSNLRNYVTMEDIPIVIKVALSTASVERITIFDHLISNKGISSTSEITRSLNVTKPTALKTMAEFRILNLAGIEEIGDELNAEKRITLKEDLRWFLSEEFLRLRQFQWTKR